MMYILRNMETGYPFDQAGWSRRGIEYLQLSTKFEIERRFEISSEQARKDLRPLRGHYVNLNRLAIGVLDLPLPASDGEINYQRWLFVDSPICRVDDVDLDMHQSYLDEKTGHFTAEYEGLLVLDIDYPRFHSIDNWFTEEEWDLFYQLAHHRR